MARKALDDAHDLGFRFIRVSISGYFPARSGTPSDIELWRRSPAVFWQRMDMMMDDLDSRSLSLVPVLMWNAAQFPAMAGETTADLVRNPQSESWRLLRSYASQFINRYANRRTILFYELTNELNLLVDLDHPGRCREVRDERCGALGNFSTEEMVSFVSRFAKLVKDADPSRLVSSGFTVPRSSAEHIRAKPQWSRGGADWRLDTKAELAKNLQSIHSPVDIISVHLYDTKENRRFGSSDPVALVDVLQAAARQANKPLFVGEFGEQEPQKARKDSYASRMLARLVELNVPYSGVWAWQFYQASPYATGTTKDSSFSLEQGRTDFLLALIARTTKASGMADKDTRPPRVVLTWPLDCSLLKGRTKLHAVASDNAGSVEKVEFWIDGIRAASDAEFPFEYEFDTARLPAGEHVLSARAFDGAGNESGWNTKVFVGNLVNRRSCVDALER
jgi:hypothetical protein